jgi:DNA-binding NarL/FixJ family response regulator
MLRQGLRGLIDGTERLSVIGEAFDGPSAMEQIRALNPAVVLLDLYLPGESGKDLAKRVISEFPAVKVIALSDEADMELVRQTLRIGISGYILKENGCEELIRAIFAVVEGRIHLSPEISSAVIKDLMKVEAKGEPGSPSLSNRERLLLRLIADGKRNKEIAETLGIAVKSAETYRLRLMKKLGCSGTADLVRYAIRENIITP